MIPGVNRPAITLLSWLGIKANQQSGPDSFGTTLAPIVDYMRYSKIGNRQFVTNIQTNLATNTFVDLVDSVTGVAATPQPGSVWEIDAVSLIVSGLNVGPASILLRPSGANLRGIALSATATSVSASTNTHGSWVGPPGPLFAYPGDTFAFINEFSAVISQASGTIFFTELRST